MNCVIGVALGVIIQLLYQILKEIRRKNNDRKQEWVEKCLPKCHNAEYKCELPYDDCFECMCQSLNRIEQQLKEKENGIED